MFVPYKRRATILANSFLIQWISTMLILGLVIWEYPGDIFVVMTFGIAATILMGVSIFNFIAMTGSNKCIPLGLQKPDLVYIGGFIFVTQLFVPRILQIIPGFNSSPAIAAYSFILLIWTAVALAWSLSKPIKNK